MESRNEPSGFAERTLKNLDFITQASPNAKVHVVAQVGNSLLGLIVFPFHKGFSSSARARKMADLVTVGWPTWSYTEGSQPETLGEFINKLRNAVCHGHWEFSSDSPDCADVRITVGEVKSWKADIGCDDLQVFCRKFIELLKTTQ